MHTHLHLPVIKWDAVDAVWAAAGVVLLLLLLLGCWMLYGLLYGHEDIAPTPTPVDGIYTCSIQTLDWAASLRCSVGVMTGVGNQ